ncbi:MAG TPA: class I SAM-dependent methyltransferase [Ferrovibrio sp.]|uniref:class I SAM-dependent methyltransferase n=1 Tax=Ferrovibrio sp. TaxID=1917215 RepID=UPI002ED37CED
MSRLDSFIRRLEAQRALINWAVTAFGENSGLALEVGLGNGRTYDHLREKLPGWRIVAFDRANNANPRSVPPPGDLILGEFADNLPAFARSHPGAAKLIHADAGLGDPEANARQVANLSNWLPPLAASGAIILSDQKLDHEALQPRVPPVEIPANRYFVYVRA